MILGAPKTGKTALVTSFIQHTFSPAYDPTIEDTYFHNAVIDRRPCQLELLDTSGDFGAMRDLYIKNGQGFVLVYDATDPRSWQEATALRSLILAKKKDSVPMVLVANKADLLPPASTGYPHMHPALGPGVALCSAKTGGGVDDVFVDLVRQIMKRDSGYHSLSSSNASLHDLAAVPNKQNSHHYLHHHHALSRTSETSLRGDDKRKFLIHSKSMPAMKKKLKSKDKEKDCIIC